MQDGLRLLVENATLLHTLDLSYTCALSDDHVVALPTNLTALSLTGCIRSNVEVSALSRLASLANLDWSWNANLDWIPLETMSRLQRLILVGCEVSARDVVGRLAASPCATTLEVRAFAHVSMVAFVCPHLFCLETKNRR